MTRLRNSPSSLLGAALLAASIGCGAESHTAERAEDAGMDAGPTTSALVRAVHLSPGAPSVDLFVDGASEPAVRELAFADGTDYFRVPAGRRDLDVAPAGGSPAASLLTLNDIDLEARDRYTVVVYDQPEDLKGLFFEDDPAGLEDDEARVRPMHAAVGIGEVDVWDVTDPGAPEVLFEDVGFGEVGQPIELPAGERANVGLDTDDDGSMEVVFEVPGVDGGTAVNLYAVTDSAGAFLLVQPPVGAPMQIRPLAPAAFLRVMHAAPAAPAVDLLVDGRRQAAAEGLAFQDSSGFLTLAPETYDVAVVPAGGDPADAVAAVDDLELEDGDFVTVAAYDVPGGVDLLELTEDYGSLASDDVRLRAVHAASAYGPIDLLDVQEPGPATILYDDLTLGTSGQQLDSAAGPRVLGLDDDGDLMPEETFSFVTPGGTFANIYVVNRPSSRSRVFLLLQRRSGAVVPVSRN